jgi:NADPH2:quinone reductase
MRVAVVTRLGGPEVLETREIPAPVAQAGEVIINVVAADVLWVETRIRQGGFFDFESEPPYVPGNGVAGTIGSVGVGVDNHWMNRVVVAHTNQRGGYAEQVAVPVEEISSVPEGVDLHAAAALLHDGPTAVALADAAKVGPGMRVLILGASGGLGILSVQLAKARGAHVVAVARDARKLPRVAELGADAVIDAEANDWIPQARATLEGPADVILDNIGGQLGEAAFELIADGGVFSAHGAPSGRFAAIDPAVAQQRGVALRGIEHLQFDPTELKRLTEQLLPRPLPAASDRSSDRYSRLLRLQPRMQRSSAVTCSVRHC